VSNRRKRRGRRNRKKHVSAVRFPGPLAAVVVCVGLLALVYLWLYERCVALGEAISRREEVRAELHRKVLNEQYKWSNMKLPQNMRKLLARHRLQMTLPDEERIVRVRTGEDMSAPAPARYAQRTELYMND